jgi:hypothetical protein
VPDDEAIASIDLMAQLESYLKTSGEVLARNVGMRTQVDILAFVKQVPHILREALQLHQVEKSVLKRCIDWYEPREVREKRARTELDIQVLAQLS